jgi:two-component system NarL family sensor kinase
MNVTGPSWRELSQEDLNLLSTIAYHVGIAVERARLAEESARLARSEERTRIAREIHDTLAQGLTAIALQVESAMRNLENDPLKAKERLQKALAMSQESLEEARRSVMSLRAPMDGRSLGDALNGLARSFTSETGIPVKMQVAGEERSLPIRVEAELFRIAQESLANVRRHSEATAATITLRILPDSVRLVVIDNGKGFDPTVVPEGHQGIIGMRERARLIGGRLRVGSRIGKGTTISATVPLSSEESA